MEDAKVINFPECLGMKRFFILYCSVRKSKEIDDDYYDVMMVHRLRVSKILMYNSSFENWFTKKRVLLRGILAEFQELNEDFFSVLLF